MVSIENASKFRNAAYIILEGKIERHIEKDLYVFTDDSGSIVINITPEKMAMLDISADDRIRVRGEIERAWFSRPTVGAIEVEVIE